MKTVIMNIMKLGAILAATSLLISCAFFKPKKVSSSRNINHKDICSSLKNNMEWYAASKRSNYRWGVPISTQMAFIYYESGFRPLAKARTSSAFGYAQVIDSTWRNYKKNTGNVMASRVNIHDATDFIGWYNSINNKKLNIPLDDPYNQYLAYHEGTGGYSRKTYQNKKWLISRAKEVKKLANKYKRQLKSCFNVRYAGNQ